MNKLSTTASTQASNWASQRREAIEKAKKLKEERKYNLAMTGEMALGNNDRDNIMYNKNSASNQQQQQQYSKPPINSTIDRPNIKANGKYGSAFLDRPPSQEELNEARNSLRLLKSKMRDTGSFNENRDEYPSRFEDSDSENKIPYKKKLGTDMDTNDMYQNVNSNYRKVFKPSQREDEYDRKSTNTSDHVDSIPRIGNTSNRITNLNKNIASGVGAFGPNDADDFVSKNPGRAGIGKKPPLSTKIQSNYSRDNDEDLTPSKFPSRIPKGNFIRDGDRDVSPGISKYSPKNNGNTRLPKRDASSSNYEANSPITSNLNTKNGLGANKQYNAFESKKSPQISNPTLSTNPSKNISGPNKNKPKSLMDMDEDNDDYGKANSKPQFNSKKSSMPTYSTSNTNRASGIDDLPIPTVAKKQNKMPEMVDQANFDEDDLVECPEGCGRKFNPQVLEKHANICKKVFQSKRKKFDSAAARMPEEMAQIQQQQPAPSNPRSKPALKAKKQSSYEDKPITAEGTKKNKWKQQSEAFRAGMRAARGDELTVQQQKAIQDAQDDGLVKCDNCGRKFNEKAAGRHIPFCEQKSKLDKFKQGGKPAPDRKNSFGKQVTGNATFKKK